MSLMSGLYVGATGLMTSSNALNTTAHNLSNMETSGYTRQQVLLEDKVYNTIGNSAIANKQIGLGVDYAKVRQVRDFFLDQSFRKESGRSAFYEINYETTVEMEKTLGEFDGVAFQDSIADIWTAIQELQKDPTSAVVQGELVNTSAQFLERAQAVYDGLSNYQDNLNKRVKDYVDRINELGDTIHDLNISIQKEEVRVSNNTDEIERSIAEANDLKDRRNAALDELSKLANIKYNTNADGAIEVNLEGITFVGRDRVFHMDTTVDLGTGFYTPVWPQNENQPVFNPKQELSSYLNTDIGELKAIVFARGDRRANYTDMADKDYYTNGGFDTTLGRDCIPVASSMVMNIQAELDNLVHTMMTNINDILADEYGTPDASRTGYSEDDVSNIYELFVRLGTDRYTDDGTGNYSYVSENNSAPQHSDISTLYTLGNVKINPDLLKQPTKLSFMTDDNCADQTKADMLAKAFTDPFGALNPNLTMQYNFADYYAAMVGQIATTGSVYNSIVQAQQVTVEQLEANRQSVMGVSSNEELSNMIKFQNAYNAASRYITTLNDMLGTIIERLGGG